MAFLLLITSAVTWAVPSYAGADLRQRTLRQLEMEQSPPDRHRLAQSLVAAGMEENILFHEAVDLVWREVQQGRVAALRRGAVSVAGSDLTKERIQGEAREIAEKHGGWLRVEFKGDVAKLLPPLPAGAEEGFQRIREKFEGDYAKEIGVVRKAEKGKPHPYWGDVLWHAWSAMRLATRHARDLHALYPDLRKKAPPEVEKQRDRLHTFLRDEVLPVLEAAHQAHFKEKGQEVSLTLGSNPKVIPGDPLWIDPFGSQVSAQEVELLAGGGRIFSVLEVYEGGRGSKVVRRILSETPASYLKRAEGGWSVPPKTSKDKGLIRYLGSLGARTHAGTEANRLLQQHHSAEAMERGAKMEVPAPGPAASAAPPLPAALAPASMEGLFTLSPAGGPPTFSIIRRRWWNLPERKANQVAVDEPGVVRFLSERLRQPAEEVRAGLKPAEGITPDRPFAEKQDVEDMVKEIRLFLKKNGLDPMPGTDKLPLEKLQKLADEIVQKVDPHEPLLSSSGPLAVAVEYALALLQEGAADDRVTAALCDTYGLSAGAEERVLKGHRGAVVSVAFSHDPKFKILASAGRDGTVRFWDWESGAERFPAIPHAGVWQVTFRASAHTILMVSPESAESWNIPHSYLHRQGVKVKTNHLAFERPIASAEDVPYPGSVAFSPGRTSVLVGGTGKEAVIHNLDEKREGLAVFQRIRPERGSPLSVAYLPEPDRGKKDPDGRVIALGTSEGTVELWDVGIRTGAERRQILKGHEGKVVSVSFDPAGKMLASADDRGVVRIWVWETGSFHEVRHAVPEEVQALAFSPDGKTLASAGTAGSVWFWDVLTGRPKGMIPGDISVSALAFRPDGKWIAAGRQDNTIRLWKVPSSAGAEEGRFTGEELKANRDRWMREFVITGPEIRKLVATYNAFALYTEAGRVIGELSRTNQELKRIFAEGTGLAWNPERYRAWAGRLPESALVGPLADRLEERIRLAREAGRPWGTDVEWIMRDSGMDPAQLPDQERILQLLIHHGIEVHTHPKKPPLVILRAQDTLLRPAAGGSAPRPGSGQPGLTAGAEEPPASRRVLLVGDSRREIDRLRKVVQTVRPDVEVESILLPEASETEEAELRNRLASAEAPAVVLVAGGLQAADVPAVAALLRHLETTRSPVRQYVTVPPYAPHHVRAFLDESIAPGLRLWPGASAGGSAGLTAGAEEVIRGTVVGEEDRRLPVEVHETPEEIGRAQAEEVMALWAGAVQARRPFVIGLPTGSTPEPLLDALVDRLNGMNAVERIRYLNRLHIVAMDDIVDPATGANVEPAHPRSARKFFQDKFLSRIDGAQIVEKTQLIIPTVGRVAEQVAHVRRMGGVAWQMMATDPSEGHVAEVAAGERFRDPDVQAKKDQPRPFSPLFLEHNRWAKGYLGITFTLDDFVEMLAENGIVSFAAFGPAKAGIVQRLIADGRYEPERPISFLWLPELAPRTRLLLDREAASRILSGIRRAALPAGLEEQKIRPVDLAFYRNPPAGSVYRLTRAEADSAGVPIHSNVFFHDGLWSGPKEMYDSFEQKGTVGTTTNQAIVQKKSGLWKEMARRHWSQGLSAEESFLLAYHAEAEVPFRALSPLREQSGGVIGQVSQEASALLSDKEALLAGMRRIDELFKEPSLVKLPNIRGAQAGLSSMVEDGPWATLDRVMEGLSGNVTLGFSVDHFLAHARGHIDGLLARAHELAAASAQQGLSGEESARRIREDFSRIHWVFSLFMSRIDRRLASPKDERTAAWFDQAIAAAEKEGRSDDVRPLRLLKGKSSVALGRFVGQVMQYIYGMSDALDDRADFLKPLEREQVEQLRADFAALRREYGALPMYLLIASSGKYGDQPYATDLQYVLPFLGTGIWNTLPPATLKALSDFVAGKDAAQVEALKAKNLIQQEIPWVEQPAAGWDEAVTLTTQEMKERGIESRSASWVLKETERMLLNRPEFPQNILVHVGNERRDAGAADFRKAEEEMLAQIGAWRREFDGIAEAVEPLQRAGRLLLERWLSLPAAQRPPVRFEFQTTGWLGRPATLEEVLAFLRNNKTGYLQFVPQPAGHPDLVYLFEARDIPGAEFVDRQRMLLRDLLEMGVWAPPLQHHWEVLNGQVGLAFLTELAQQQPRRQVADLGTTYWTRGTVPSERAAVMADVLKTLTDQHVVAIAPTGEVAVVRQYELTARPNAADRAAAAELYDALAGRAAPEVRPDHRRLAGLSAGAEEGRFTGEELKANRDRWMREFVITGPEIRKLVATYNAFALYTEAGRVISDLAGTNQALKGILAEGTGLAWNPERYRAWAGRLPESALVGPLADRLEERIRLAREAGRPWGTDIEWIMRDSGMDPAQMPDQERILQLLIHHGIEVHTHPKKPPLVILRAQDTLLRPAAGGSAPRPGSGQPGLTAGAEEDHVLSLEQVQRAASWETLFGNNRPVALEIGPGNGEALYWRAVEEPGVNFLGVDVMGTPPRGYGAYPFPPNVRFLLKTDIREVLEEIPAPMRSFRKIYMDFPPTPISADYFFLEPPAIQSILRSLVPGGELILRTEEAEIVRRIEQATAEQGGFGALQVRRAVHHEGMPESAWSADMEDHGMPTYVVRYQRTAGAEEAEPLEAAPRTIGVPEAKPGLAGFVADAGIGLLMPARMDPRTRFLVVAEGLPQASLLADRGVPSGNLLVLVVDDAEKRKVARLLVPENSIFKIDDFGSITEARRYVWRLAQSWLKVVDGAEDVFVLRTTARTLAGLLAQLKEILPLDWQESRPITSDDLVQALRLYELGV